MSDLLTSASEVMGLPEALVSRSADARATVNGTTRDEILTAWAGGEAVAMAAPAAPAQPEPSTAPMPESETVPIPDAVPVTVATIEPQETLAAAPAMVEPEVDEDIEPVPLGQRLRTATRVGAWTGAILGLFAFLMASVFWAPNASVIGEETFSPVVLVDPTDVMIAVALVSVLLGAIVAGLSRAAAGWVNKGMRLSNSPFSTSLLGATLGLVLGLVAAALLTSVFGEAIEGVENVVQLPVLATLAVMMIGGALLGATTAAIPQLIGVPVAVGSEGDDEVAEVRGRLGGAIGVPVVAASLLALLVLPFAYTLIESDSLTGGGAAIIAVITASGILAFASLGGSKPNMRLSFGEVMVAVAGIATVVVVIFMVLSARNGDDGGHHDQPADAEAAIVQLLS